MNKKQTINGVEKYLKEEARAIEYFELLKGQLNTQNYISICSNDLNEWKKKHLQQTVMSRFSKRNTKPAKRYSHYIRWLNQNGKLEQYLDRSVSYIFLRDLGKTLDSPDTEKRINEIVQNLKINLTNSRETVDSELFGNFNKVDIYRKAQKEGFELTIIWLFQKLSMISKNLPEELDPVNAQRKLMKIIGGVVMHYREELLEGLNYTERAQKISEAIRLGYSYGLTYPFIDDLLDSNILSPNEKEQYSNFIRTTLTTGSVPPFENWTGSNHSLMKFIHAELSEAFDYIKLYQSPNKRVQFLEQAYIFFQSQEIDRNKNLKNSDYTNEEIYVPVILKSAYSRMIARSIINSKENNGFDDRTFYYGIYNQLADDFSDMFHDLENGAVTPYTYYLTYYKKRDDLINPFEMYWSVISYLIHHVYKGHTKTRDVILNRAINGLRRFKEKMGEKTYAELIGIFTENIEVLNQELQLIVKKASDVDFYDKLLRDQMISQLEIEKTEKEQFEETFRKVRRMLNDKLHISEDDLLNDSIVDAANYSLSSDGKRLRPVLTWLMGVEAFNLKETSILPLLKSLEYMHTASLIFDDLPSQDNAETRRGKPTLHVSYNEAIAQLTGLYLTQKAYEEQTMLQNFNAEVILTLIRYSSEITASMCKGQAMDLASKERLLTIDELEEMCFYKTGLGFEASLVMPAILAQVPKYEIDSLKKFAKHAGIAFQIKDDLLDVEGEFELIGKPVGIDEYNKSSTFVSVLGKEEAQKMMWEHYCIAYETLQTVPYNVKFLKYFLDFIVNRNH